MELKEKILSLKSHYRSGKDDLGHDFFTPCLSQCSQYKRAAGYFSSSALVSWSGVLPKIVKDDAISVKLLISPNLTAKDKEALQNITDPIKKEEFLQNISDQIVSDAIEFSKGNQSEDKRMRLFSWLVAVEKLELRFAYPYHVEEPGIFHEKIGIFEFPWGDKIAFTGSANESEMGHKKNYESVDVFRSWVSLDIERVVIKEGEFDEAWNGNAEGLRIKRLSKALVDRIKEYSPTKPDNFNETDEQPKFGSVGKWRHQDMAVEAFLLKERGVLEMATGTGKTRTALRICNELVNSNKVSSIIISMDGNDLLDQWYVNVLKELKKLGGNFAVIRHYNTFHQKEYYIIDPEWKILIISRPQLHNVLRNIPHNIARRTLLIHDEVHRLGSPANRRDLAGLTDRIKYCLGLSATPEREYDEDGNHFITQQVGPTIFSFGIEEAIKRGILCPFNYFPIEYEITDEDKNEIKKLRARYEALKGTSTPMSQESLWTSIANVFKTSPAKIPLFKSFIATHQDLLKRCIIFVGTQEYGESILNIVHKYNPDFHTYFSGEDSDTLKRFAKGDLECLITCHRLSEGIDIQSLNNVILFASDRARLELIQRIGRCLRTDPENPNKCANVIDFIRITSKEGKEQDEDKQSADDLRREWLSKLSQIRPEE